MTALLSDDAQAIFCVIYKAHGAFTHNQKMIIMSVMKRGQAVQLRNFVKRYQPGAFIAIVNSSEIIGKGFRGLN